MTTTPLAWALRATKPRRHQPLSAMAVLPLLALASLASGSAVAQSTRLSAILEMARTSDAQYAAARAAAESTREKLPQALATIRPNVNLSWSIKVNQDGSSAYPGTLGYDAGGAAITVNQPLFRLANMVGIAQAEVQVLQASQQLALAGQEMLLRVARGYFDVLQSQDELAAATAQKDAMVQQLAQTRRSFEVGTVPVTDFNESQARHDLAVAQEIAARNDLASKKRVLEKSIARPLPMLARVDPAITIVPPSDATQQAWVEAASRSALQVLIARSNVELAEKEIARREAGHHPTLDLVASINSNRNVNYGQFGGNDTRQVSVGVEIGLPLYQGGAISSRTREAMADLRRAQQELANAERQALLDAQQAQLGVASGSALTQALLQALASSETQLRSTQRGLQVGVRTRVDVLNAEQQLYATRKDLAVARYRTLVAGLQLRAAAGMLTEADLRGLDSLLID